MKRLILKEESTPVRTVITVDGEKLCGCRRVERRRGAAAATDETLRSANGD